MPTLPTASIERRILGLTVGEKISLARKGDQEARRILVRDTNRQVATAVVQSDRLTPTEVISFASNKQLSQNVVHAIATNRKYVRAYPVKVALVNNPKTPLSVAVQLINHLYKRDLLALANNRNVPSAVFTKAKRQFRAKHLR
ncbi:MAG: hypothetical protein ACPGU1_17775 [Myxococcota bacterium]